MKDSTEMLFVRACKSKKPSVRVRSVYRRMYTGNDGIKLMSEDAIMVNIIQILTFIIWENNLLDSRKYFELIMSLNPEFQRYVGVDKSFTYTITKLIYLENAMSELIDLIRYAHVDKFPGILLKLKY